MGYLSKVGRDLAAFALVKPSVVREAARALRHGETGTAAYARGREWWKLAWYWATDTRVATVSPVLWDDDGEGNGDGGRE